MELIHERLPLSIDGTNLYVIRHMLEERKEELEKFLQDNKYMNSKEFSRNVLFSQEIKTNNMVEGYNDDVGLVYDILNKKLSIKDKEKMQRIINLYNGYRFIFENKDISKENLKKLYTILSKNLLTHSYIDNMGEYYREGPVYIYFSHNLDVEPDEGVENQKIEQYMNEYFDYVKADDKFNSITDYFIKS